MAPKILVILTNIDKIESTGQNIGWYLPELARPYEILTPKAELIIASPKGGLAPLDLSSIEAYKTDGPCQNFLKDQKHLWENTLPVHEFLGRASEFEALFFPGGHGPMFDLATDSDSIELIKEFYEAGKILAAICHGPAAFVNVVVNGKHILYGRKVTALSNEEEEYPKDIPFALETALEQTGAEYVHALEKWGEKVVVDGPIITGQNPASSRAIANAIIKAIDSS
ncbi:DJ-1/PfpI family protein [Trichoderma velutinum]